MRREGSDVDMWDRIQRLTRLGGTQSNARMIPHMDLRELAALISPLNSCSSRNVLEINPSDPTRFSITHLSLAATQSAIRTSQIPYSQPE